MKEVIMTKGLPGSGKTTWAKRMVDEETNVYKRINKDDLRAMLDNGNFSKANEKLIIKVRDQLILAALENGNHVIVDDTNLAPKHEAHIRQLIKGKAELIIEDFTWVPLETCIMYDLKRPNSVGSKVIKRMYRQFLEEPEVYEEDEDLPRAIIVDIDGTLAKMNDRSPYDWHKVGEDSCNLIVEDIIHKYDGEVILMSGRDGVCYDLTEDWLGKHGIGYHKLFMRPEGNIEKDSIIKRRMFDENIRGKYYIDFVLDDRNQVVDMWRGMGLTCLQVAEGDF